MTNEIKAAIVVNRLVTISEKKMVNDFPKYPITDPTKGKNITAYSI